MADQRGTLETLITGLAQVFEPLFVGMQPGEVRRLLAELGYFISAPQEAAILPTTTDVANKLRSLFEIVSDLTAASESGNTAQIVQKGTDAVLKLRQVVDSLTDLKNAVSGLGLPGTTPAEVDELPQRLFNHLLVATLGTIRGLNGTLEFAEVLKRTDHNVDSPDAPPFTVSVLDFNQLLAWLRDPGERLRTLYQWGDPGFDGSLLFQKLATLIAGTGLPVIYEEPPPRLDAVLLDLTAPPTLNPRGVKLGLNLQFNPDPIEFRTDDWVITVRSEVSIFPGSGITLQPDGHLEVFPPGPGSEIAGEFNLDFTTTTGPYILLGKAGSSRLELQLGGFGTGTRLVWSPADGKATGSFNFEGRLEKGLVLIDASEGDGFLTKIIPGTRIQGNFDLKIGFARETGLFIQGSGALEIRIPMHLTLGPIEFQGLTISVSPKADHVAVGLGADIRAELGPLTVVVENMGVKAKFSFPDGGGNLGPLDFELAFQPPRGVGLAVDAGVIKGGGFLRLDSQRGEYAGALELVFSEFLTLKAIGIITTKMPDGSKGFSLLIIITAEFGTGFQLGFGFTLLAVGGLIGANRTMNLQALLDGVRTGAVESVMFPRDIIANAPRIISDLRAFFPPREGQFLVGPMAKIGWGTPTLISISMGIIIEIPGNIAILGVLKVAIPADEIALIVLQVNFVGALEFDRKRFYFFAALFESRIVFVTIEGEMGVLVAFGDDKNLVVSVGGFHPRFNPPPLPFPSPRRISVSLLNRPVARIYIEGYFALTSNTAQFGARAEVFFGLGNLNVQGHVVFDALFQFSPFYFLFEISASLSVKVFGVGLFSVKVRGTLDGPAPYHIKGHGSISLLFWSIGVDFQATWGETVNTELPPIAVMPMFAAEINKAENWRALLPASSNLLVSLRKMPVAESTLILHPLGVLSVSQRALPLELTLDKVGTQKPSDVKRLSLVVTGGGLSKKEDAFEQFAAAQFQEFSDAEKLSLPAFAPERSGVNLSSEGAETRSSLMIKRVVRYEEIIIDSNFKRFQRRFSGFFGTLFEFFLGGNSASRCELSQTTKQQLQPFAEKIDIQAETYTVAFQSNNRAFAADSVSFLSEASARDYRNRKIAADTSLAEEIHVIPSFEMAA